MRRRLSQLCVLFVAISVIFAGMSAGHAAGAPDCTKHHLAHDGHMALHGVAATSAHLHAAAFAMAVTDGAGTATHGATDGCCHVASFPSAAPNDVMGLPLQIARTERPKPPYDESAIATDPEGQLRPPRPAA